MNCIINIPQEAYDLIIGKIDTANLDLYSILIQSVKNSIPLDKIRDEIAQLHSDMNVINYNLAIGNVLDIIDKY